MAILRSAPLVLAILAACGDDGGNGPVDAPPVTQDIDNASCGDQLRFTGEYVDWDFEQSSCGIFDALFEVQGGNGGMDHTAPNGRFDLCISSSQDTVLLDVTTDPLADSMCSDPASPYPLPAIAVARKAVILGPGGAFSARNFTAARRDTFFAGAGLTFDAAKAHVHVHVIGTPRAVALGASHDAAQAYANTAWAAGDTGKEVFFPNVEVGTGTTMLTVTGGAIGAGEIPLAAGTLTTITVIAN